MIKNLNINFYFVYLKNIIHWGQTNSIYFLCWWVIQVLEFWKLQIIIYLTHSKQTLCTKQGNKTGWFKIPKQKKQLKLSIISVFFYSAICSAIFFDVFIVSYFYIFSIVLYYLYLSFSLDFIWSSLFLLYIFSLFSNIYSTTLSCYITI